MKILWLAALVALIAISCASAPTSAQEPSAKQQICSLAEQIDAVFDGVEDERQFTTDERETVRNFVDDMRPLVPAELDSTFRLRYWPHTSVVDLDTSGIATQAAYDEWRSFRSASC